MKIYQKADGGVLKSAREYDIATNAQIKAGQVVQLTAGFVTAAIQKQTAAILGVALENHTGSADALDPRANGGKISVCDTPDAIYKCAAPVVTASGGTATTVTASTLGAFSNDDFNGGLLILVEKASGSTNMDEIGTVKRITDYAYNSTGTVSTFTVATGGAANSGDKYVIIPPVGFRKGQLDSTLSKLDLTDTASLALKVVGYDLEKRELCMMAAIHALGVDNS